MSQPPSVCLSAETPAAIAAAPDYPADGSVWHRQRSGYSESSVTPTPPPDGLPCAAGPELSAPPAEHYQTSLPELF